MKAINFESIAKELVVKGFITESVLLTCNKQVVVNAEWNKNDEIEIVSISAGFGSKSVFFKGLPVDFEPFVFALIDEDDDKTKAEFRTNVQKMFAPVKVFVKIY
jgi:hypothetical protein